MKSYGNYEKVKGGKGVYAAVAICFIALVLSATGIYFLSQRNTPGGGDIPPSPVEYSTDNAKADAKKNDVKDERAKTTEDRNGDGGLPQTQTTEHGSTSAEHTQPTETQTVPTAHASDTDEENAKNEYSLPMGTSLSKDYSLNTPVYSKTMNDWRVHCGIDFSGEEGEQVKSIGNGKVTKIYSDEKWGTVAEIQYGVSLTVRYCGLEQGTTVKPDDVVQKGETVGSLGTIPCEALDGAHLHIETLIDGEYTDPLEIFGMAESTFAD